MIQMNGEKNKKTIVELDEGADLEMKNIHLSSSKQYSPLISRKPSEQPALAESTNAEYLSDKMITETKSMKSDKPHTKEISNLKKVIIKPMDIDTEESFVQTLFKVPFKFELEFTRSDNFEYNTKILKKTLEESIAELAKNMGQGIVGPVPYDTAWVARIPQTDNISRPAFPLSLQWLHDHQLEDGSWGSVIPFSPHSSTLNTLATIIALAQWNNPDDKVCIEKGVKALWRLAKLLPSEPHEYVGFELIIFTLLREARKYGLALPYEHYECYKQKSDRKLKLIISEFRKYGYSKPATWWYNLEILGDEMQINVGGNELRFSPNMLTKDGSVGLSPAATAYLLMTHRLKGVDIPEAEKYLKHLYSLYAGGIPTLSPIDIFELGFGIDLLLKSSFHAKHPLLKSAIERLAKSWDPKYGVGWSANWELFDADDSAVTLFILLKAGYKLSPEPILRCFNGSHIAAYVGEATPSISVNIHALNALRLFNGDKEINDVIQKMLIWMDECVLDEQVFTYDKWNISPYYSPSRAVFTLHGLRNDIVKRCLNFFIRTQNRDGSWGKDGSTIAEETAYVSLALCHGLKCGYPVPVTILEAASIFLFNSPKLNMPPIWLGKVLYCPILISKTAIISAQFALVKTLELVRVKLILEEIRPYYVEANVKATNIKKNYDIFLFCLAPEFDISKYSKQIIRVREYIINRLVDLNLIKISYYAKKLLVPEVTLYMSRKELGDEDIILISYCALSIFIYDDIIDNTNYQSDKNHFTIKRIFQVFLEILQGKYESNDTIIPADFPEFISQCKFFFDMRHILVKNQLDLSEFLSRQEEVLSYYMKDVDCDINGVCVSSGEYLELKKFTWFGYTFHGLYFTLAKVRFSSFKEYDVFQKFEDCALKVGRLLLDIVSPYQDIDKDSFQTSYILIKQSEYNCSTEDAINASVKLFNKQILKMYSLKKVMQQDPIYKNNQELQKAIAIIENVIQGTIDWSLETKIYQSKTTISISRKQFTEVNLPLILQFFENKANDSFGQNSGDLA